MIMAGDFRKGITVEIDGNVWSVVDFQHVKPGKGAAFVRTKLKNVMSGKGVDKTFNAGVKVETATVDRRDMQFSYLDGDMFVFMDTSNWEQTSLTPEIVGDAKDFMTEGQDVIVAFHEGQALFVEMPASVVLTIEFTEPGLQGDRSSGGTKPARLQTGREIQVPLFLNEGDQVKVDTRGGDYLERVK